MTYVSVWLSSSSSDSASESTSDSVIYTRFKKRCREKWRMVNGQWWLHDRIGLWVNGMHMVFRCSFKEMSENSTSNVYLRVFDPEDRKKSRHYQLKDVPFYEVSDLKQFIVDNYGHDIEVTNTEFGLGYLVGNRRFDIRNASPTKASRGWRLQNPYLGQFWNVGK